MDSIDRKLLRRLMRDGRATWAALGGVAGLSAAAAAQRVKRLEEAGVISGYAARVDAEQAGAALLAFVSVRFTDPARRAAFLKRVKSLPWVQECHHVTGDMDYLLKLRCGGTRDLERLISVELKDRCKVSETRTSIVLASAKETAEVALPE
jgi:Lrp/AsnC family leucine-responsive transcriptional regulator